MKGFIDCILIAGSEVHIFDFKRSASSIGSKKELLEFEKIQLWIYRWALSKKYNVAWWGYINLSDGSMTGLHGSEVEACETFENFLITLINKYKDEIEFAPDPRTDKVCTFCELQLFCPKERLL